MKISKLLNKNYLSIFVILFFLLNSFVAAEDMPVDIWNLEKKNEENKINSEKKDIGWGNQIRSYVLHPYKLIKDLRTNYETSNASDVLDGKIDRFLELSLTQ